MISSGFSASSPVAPWPRFGAPGLGRNFPQAATCLGAPWKRIPRGKPAGAEKHPVQTRRKCKRCQVSTMDRPCVGVSAIGSGLKRTQREEKKLKVGYIVSLMESSIPYTDPCVVCFLLDVGMTNDRSGSTCLSCLLDVDPLPTGAADVTKGLEAHLACMRGFLLYGMFER